MERKVWFGTQILPMLLIASILLLSFPSTHVLARHLQLEEMRMLEEVDTKSGREIVNGYADQNELPDCERNQDGDCIPIAKPRRCSVYGRCTRNPPGN